MKTIGKMQQILRSVGIKTDLQPTNDPKWKRMFLRYNNVTIGRISFLNGEPNAFKSYQICGIGIATARAVFNYQVQLGMEERKAEKWCAIASLHVERIAELETELAKVKRSKLLSWWGKNIENFSHGSHGGESK